MTPPRSDDRPTLAPAVKTLLDAVRRRIRRYVWIEGIAAVAAWLGAAFWLTLATDWFFEPPPIVRLVALAAVASAAAVVFVRRIVRRAFVPITDANAATVLERRFPHFQDALLTAVALGGRESTRANRSMAADAADIEVGLPMDFAPVDAALYDAMLARTCREAAARASDVNPADAFNPRPLRRRGGVAVALAVSVAMFAVLFPGLFGVWANRALGLSSRPWPRTVHFLPIDGFFDGVRKVARGADFEIIARADARSPHRVPRVAEIRYQIEGGLRGRATMDRRGTARGGEDCQEYVYTFRNVLSDVRFDVVGGDDRLRDLKIVAVDSPVISQMTLHCTLPAYIRRRQPPLPVTGVMQIPAGSRVVVRAAQANKELVRVRVGIAFDDPTAPTKTSEDAVLSADRRGFSYAIERLDRDATLSFTLFDVDGIASREPVRLTLTATPDQPPQPAVQLDGIGAAVTPQARIAVVGRVADDNGLGRVQFEYSVDERPPAVQTIAELSNAPTVFHLKNVGLEIRDLGLKPGQKLAVSVQATDLCDLGRGPNQAGSERWLLEVVAPEQLRAMLESRELVLRQRFERIMQEMTETRNLIAHLTLDAAAENAEWSKTAAALKKSDEPGDAESSEASPERRRMLRMLRVQGAATNSLKNAQETLGVVESFDDIRKQLVNNRIDTVDWKNRLQTGIAEPLRTVVEKMFPEFDRRLEKLRAGLDDRGAAPALREQAQQQADAILLAMRKVLDRMLEMEDYNEAVELLRGIIKMQEQLKEQTQQRHKQKIRDLLKD